MVCSRTPLGNCGRLSLLIPKLAPVDWKTLESIFLSAGFRFQRQEGSHRSYIKEGIARPVVIPTYSEIPVFIIRNNLKTAGISRDEYFRLLERTR
jgi:predicted RNA binding protein YcfA (HicA-like mRNA interferase family)